MINKTVADGNLAQEYWDGNYFQNLAPVYPVNYVTDFAFKNFKRGGKVLDLGCGMGRHVKFLADFGFKAFGCDYSSQGVLYTKELLKNAGLKADVKEANMFDLPYDDDFFDGLINYGVLFYAKDEAEVKKALSEVYRVLKKGGSAFFQIRNLEDDRYKQAIKKSKYTAVANQIEGRMGFLEKGIQNYYFDEEEVKRLFGIFDKIEINYTKRSYDNESYQISYYLIGAWK